MERRIVRTDRTIGGFQRSKQATKQEGGGVSTYLAAAGLWVTAASVAVAVAALTGAQVEARAGPRVALIALLQREEGE